MKNTKTIKLMFVDDTLDIGGKEILLLNILKNIDKARFETHLAILSGKGILLKEAEKYVRDMVPVARLHKIDIKTILRLRRYIIKNRINIIHTNGWIDSLYILLASVNLPIIKIVTIHGYEKGWKKFLQKIVLKYFEGVIAVSYSLLKNLLKDNYKFQKSFVVYNCYDTERFKPKNGLYPHIPPKLVMVSRFDWSKQQDVVVNAVDILLKSGINVKMDFIGGGENKYINPVKKLVLDKKLSNNIHFLGTIKDLESILQNYDIFIMSSFSETFGITIIEAMAEGLPVIASDIGPFREILGENEYGLLFKIGDAKSLANRIKMLIKDKRLYRIMLRKALQRARNFKPENTVTKLEEIYELLYEGR